MSQGGSRRPYSRGGPRWHPRYKDYWDYEQNYRRHECASDNVHVYAPMYDFAPPDHITLFITNLGGSSPSYMYRLLSELYDPNDYNL